MSTEDTLRTEYSEALTSWRGQITTSVQIVMGLAAVNATLLGLAVEMKNPWLLASGAVLCLIVFIALAKGEFDIRLSIVRALQIEGELGLQSGFATRWFVASYGLEDLPLATERSDNVAVQLENIKLISPAPVVNHYRWVIFTAGAIQCGLFFILGFGCNWF